MILGNLGALFGKLYLLGIGITLFFIGTMLSFIGSSASAACARVVSLPSGLNFAFNPCPIFLKLPAASIAVQIIGIAMLAVGVFLVFKEIKKPRLFCPKCNAPIPKDSAYCSKCGAGVSQEKEKK